VQSISAHYERLDPPPPSAALKASVEQVRGRGLVSIVQQPAADNDYTLIVEFDDNAAAGPADYVADIRFPGLTSTSTAPR